MIFSSLTFLCIFLPALAGIYFLVRPAGAKNCVLCAASLLFYAFGEPVYIFLMIASILMNYLLGRAVKGRKAVLAAAVILNLAALGVFKYAGWITEMISSAFGLNVKISLSLPIGISFYTFQALSYVIDVYRGDCGNKG